VSTQNDTPIARMARRSSFTRSDAECVVQVNLLGPAWVSVKDGNSPDGPELLFTASEWRAFLAGVRNGEFDLHAEDGW
jgi:hypothetical protein